MTETDKKLKKLINHINNIRRTCKRKNLWLGAGYNSLIPATDESQQGPMINKLYDIVDECSVYLKKKGKKK